MIGTFVGHYRLVDQIGAGGKGVVFRAHDERLDRDVAIKILKAGTLADRSARARFRHEALALSRLNHPNVTVVHELGTHDNLDYLVMEYVPGTLLSCLALPLAERDVLRIGGQLLSGLAAAHAAGVIHRDVKPGNIRMTPDGLVKLMDFGLAHRLPRVSDATETDSGVGSAIEGTPPYMAPEQLLGSAPDVRSDVYGAGAVLYELATGRPPFQPDQFVRLADQILHDTPPPPRTLNPEMSAGLEAVILKALDRDPDLRYQTARELAVDLERLRQPSDSFAPTPHPRRTWLRRLRRARAALLAGAVLVLTVLAVWWIGGTRGGRGALLSPGDRVLVADFDNRAGPAFDAFRGLLVSRIRQSGRVSVFGRDSVREILRLMDRDPDSAVDEDTGLEICRREGMKVLIVGAIEPVQASTSIVVRGIAAASGQVLFTEPASIRSEADVGRAADSVGARIRRRLGESLRQIEDSEPLDRVVTRSTEALELYTQATDLLGRGDSAEAENRLKGALQLDPEFAMARFLLARIYRDSGDPEHEGTQLELAYQGRERLPTRERLLVEAAYLNKLERYQDALAKLQQAAGIFNQDWEVRYELAAALNDAGDRRGSIENMRKAADLNPGEVRPYSGLAQMLALDSREEEALEVCAEARRRKLEAPVLELAEGLALFASRHLQRARSTFEQMAASAARDRQTLGQLYLIQIDLFEGQFSKAMRDSSSAIERMRVLGQLAPERVLRYMLGRTYLLVGRPALAVAEARHLKADQATVNHLYLSGLLLVRGQQLREARRVLERLRALEASSADAYTRACARGLAAQVLFAEDDVARAASLFREASAHNPQDNLLHEGLARVHERTGRWADAVYEWEQVVGSCRGELFRHGFTPDWVAAQLALAAARQMTGDTDGARHALGTALDVWHAADETDAVRRGKEEWRKLTGTEWQAPPRKGNSGKPEE